MASSDPPTPARLVSLDAFRGLAMAMMVIVNNPGDWGTVYWPLLHADWHGWTPTDLVFPFFLFIVGVAMTFSRRIGVGEAARRSAILIGLGLFLAAYPYFRLGELRWPGVLQRIGVVYFLAFLALKWLGRRGIVALMLLILLGYWGLMTLAPIPDGTAPNLEPGTNLAAWVDRATMEGHLWRSTKTWDPEGPLSTLPALATTLLGILAGWWIRSARERPEIARGLAAAGAAATGLGLLWGRVFPINKALWTSSYAIFGAGASALALALFYWVHDVRGGRFLARPLTILGRNAIVLFVGSGLFVRTLLWWGWKRPIYEVAFASWLPPHPASLAFALANLALWYAVLRELDRRKLYLRV